MGKLGRELAHTRARTAETGEPAPAAHSLPVPQAMSGAAPPPKWTGLVCGGVCFPGIACP